MNELYLQSAKQHPKAPQGALCTTGGKTNWSSRATQCDIGKENSLLGRILEQIQTSESHHLLTTIWAGKEMQKMKRKQDKSSLSGRQVSCRVNINILINNRGDSIAFLWRSRPTLLPCFRAWMRTWFSPAMQRHRPKGGSGLLQ